MAEGRVSTALAGFDSLAIGLDIEDLGKKINELISDVGQINIVTAGDLVVAHDANGHAPATIVEALAYGTKFFDAVYYFAMDPPVRPATVAKIDVVGTKEQLVSAVKHKLLWTALFLMLRGSYPESDGVEVGRDIPAFLVNICGMNISPKEVAEGLASFDLKKINCGWIKSIKWDGLAPAIKQRLALGLAGYRLLGPFKIYECRANASAEVRAAFEWTRRVAVSKPDYAILSCTRSPALISQLGSWNKALGNLILQCFTDEEITEMLALKILFQRPTFDPRANTWRSWVASGELELNSPIAL